MKLFWLLALLFISCIESSHYNEPRKEIKVEIRNNIVKRTIYKNDLVYKVEFYERRQSNLFWWYAYYPEAKKFEKEGAFEVLDEQEPLLKWWELEDRFQAN